MKGFAVGRVRPYRLPRRVGKGLPSDWKLNFDYKILILKRGFLRFIQDILQGNEGRPL